jgi:quercetin dioxygenase-like cupin family protein
MLKAASLSAKETPMTAPARKVVYADIKPQNSPERAAHYVDAPGMPWEKTKFPGIQIKVLYTDNNGVTTALFKLEPGAVVPLHEHTALEQTYVIEGSLEDHEGKCGPGQFVWRPAGNQHEAVAPSGAILLGFFLKPNRFGAGRAIARGTTIDLKLVCLAVAMRSRVRRPSKLHAVSLAEAKRLDSKIAAA